MEKLEFEKWGEASEYCKKFKADKLVIPTDLFDLAAALKRAYDAGLAENKETQQKLARAEKIIAEIHDDLYGHNFMVSGYHLNDALEPLDNWFDYNDWTL